MMTMMMMVMKMMMMLMRMRMLMMMTMRMLTMTMRMRMLAGTVTVVMVLMMMMTTMTTMLIMLFMTMLELTPKDNWRLGISSLLASALGLASFKNVFWSSERNPGNKFYYDCMEVNNNTDPNVPWNLSYRLEQRQLNN